MRKQTTTASGNVSEVDTQVAEISPGGKQPVDRLQPRLPDPHRFSAPIHGMVQNGRAQVTLFRGCQMAAFGVTPGNHDT